MLRLGFARLGWLPTTLLGYVVAGAVSVGVVSPPEHCPAPSEQRLLEGASAAVGWLVTNQHEDGSYLYEYRRDDDTVVDAYNVVRHAGVVMSLYMAAGYGIDGAAASADRGLAWALDRLTWHDDWAAAGSGPGDASVGATSLLLVALAERRDQTGDQQHDRVMAELGRFLVGQVQPDGAIAASYDTSRWQPVAEARSVYYTGEAYWALVQMRRLFPDGPWTEAVDRVSAYIAGPRDAAEDMIHVRDHWAAYGYSELAALAVRGAAPAMSDDELAYSRHQAGIAAATVRWLSQQAGPWGSVVRGPVSVRGGGYGTIGEQLTRLWRLALDEPGLADLREPLGRRALCLAALTLSHQSSPADAAGSTVPGRVSGAWFLDGVTRMDDQQHALSSLLQSVDIVRGEGIGPHDTTGRPDANLPSRLLWFLALVGVLNPAWIGLAVRRLREERLDRGAPARTPIVPVVIGIAVAVVVLVVAALAGDAVLDALAVSRPAFRVSAGALGALTGMIELVRRARPSGASGEPSPVVATVRVLLAVASAPALVLAVSAGADRGLVVVLLAMVASGALAALVASLPDARPARLAVEAVRRGAAALLAVTGVLLVVAGVLSV